jgi:glucose-6-phosphate isomerase
MNYSKQQLWERFQKHYTEFPALGLALDLSRMNIADDFFAKMEPRLQKAFAAMRDLEKGAIANPDEKRMVGHYWLRNPALAPTPDIRREIEETLVRIKAFAKQVHDGQVRGVKGPFKNLLLIGIGGSALGPQFVAHALGQPGKDRIRPYYFDNTDPDGFDRVFAVLGAELGQTLCVVISKSGGTPETQNGMLEAKAAYERAGLDFGKHAVVVTMAGSKLDKYATQNSWLARFPMWDWVGGRVSELSAVGLLPAALQGFDVDSMIFGAKSCDELTRIPNVHQNPAAQLALAWFSSGNGKGTKNMVVLPYKDRLALFSKYLQQLVMESLGKELDLAGNVVNQGISVLGNKGSTDQHSYIQQLRDGLNDFFATFIEVLRHRDGKSVMVDRSAGAGDYLTGFMLGTRRALYEKGRESVTITVVEVSPFTVGLLIALFERAVGLYASLIGINAYHQPGVEAGKKAAGELINLEVGIIEHLGKVQANGETVEQIAAAVRAEDEIESVFKICQHLAANPDRRVVKEAGKTPFDAVYRKA